jgi:RimJ/RimL family protein N-acetyltransferase
VNEPPSGRSTGHRSGLRADEPPSAPSPSLPPPPPSTGRPPLPEITLEATARSFYKQALGYGFALGDFVRFANILLGIVMSRRAAPPPAAPPGEGAPRRAYHALPIAGREVTIRRFGEPGDRPLLDRWVADPEGRFFLLSTASGRAHDVDGLLESPNNLVGMVLHEGRPVGCVAYLDVAAEQRRAELRKMIGEPAMRGRGLMREAAELWVGYGLGALGLRKIYLNTLTAHIGNIKLNEEIGFRVEGILRGEVLVDGEPHDVLRMGLLEE